MPSDTVTARLRPVLLGLAVVALTATRAPQGPSPHAAGNPARRMPSPTENRRTADEEEKNARRRAEWIDAMHRAAPGTDWRAIERENRATLALRQQALAQAGGRARPRRASGARGRSWGPMT